MKKLSKRLTEHKSKIESGKLYKFDEAIKVIKNLSSVKFIETIEAHISLNIDPKYNNQQLRATLILPKGTGKSLRIAVITSEDLVDIALSSGADVAGSENLIQEILKENINFDVLIATPDQMPKLAKLGKVLGPKGLMPSPKSGTVTKDIKEAIVEFKKGKLEYRADKTGIVHIPFGKINFAEDDLCQNLLSVYQSIEKNKPSGVKGKYFKSFYICSTMSKSVQIDLTSLS
jgi:large subunit ribosomal protein L1